MNQKARGAERNLIDRYKFVQPKPYSHFLPLIEQWRAEAVIQLQDQQLSAIKVVNLALKATRRSATAKKIRAAMHFANRGFVTACCFLQTLLGISLLRWRKRAK